MPIKKKTIKNTVRAPLKKVKKSPQQSAKKPEQKISSKNLTQKPKTHSVKARKVMNKNEPLNELIQTVNEILKDGKTYLKKFLDKMLEEKTMTDQNDEPMPAKEPKLHQMPLKSNIEDTKPVKKEEV